MRFSAVSRIVLLVTLLASACSSADTDLTATTVDFESSLSTSTSTSASTSASGSVTTMFPDVVNVVASKSSSGWTFDVTLSSPYDTPERYADAWRVVGSDGTVFGVRELDHDHASEQPFTRSLPDVQIPDDVDKVVIEGRDQVSGYGGKTFEVTLIRG